MVSVWTFRNWLCMCVQNARQQVAIFQFKAKIQIESNILSQCCRTSKQLLRWVSTQNVLFVCKDEGTLWLWQLCQECQCIAIVVIFLKIMFWKKKMLQKNRCCGQHLFIVFKLDSFGNFPQISTSTFCHCQLLVLFTWVFFSLLTSDICITGTNYKYRHKYRYDTNAMQIQILLSEFFPNRCLNPLSMSTAPCTEQRSLLFSVNHEHHFNSIGEISRGRKKLCGNVLTSVAHWCFIGNEFESFRIIFHSIIFSGC